MEWLVTNAVALLILPPGILLLAATGALLALRRPRVGGTLVWLAMIALYVLSTQYTADRLLHTLEPAAGNPLSDRTTQAIVVLGGGTYFAAPESAACF